MTQLHSIVGSKIPFLACIETVFPNSETAGTGTLISPRLLLTAGHVVFDPSHGGNPLHFNVTLGSSNRRTVRATNWRSTTAWIDNDSKLTKTKEQIEMRALSAADVGIVILDDPIDTTIVRPNFDTTTENVLEAFVVNVAGYSNVASQIPDLAFYSKTRPLVMDNVDHRITYPVSTIAGMSGGPVWTFGSGKTNGARDSHIKIPRVWQRFDYHGRYLTIGHCVAAAL